MYEPSLTKATSATVQLVPHLSMDGAEVVIALIKQRFVVDPRGRAERVEGAEVRVADVPWDEDAPETSSVKFPSDVCLIKPATDVLCVGSAVAPNGARQTVLDVMVRVGPVQKVLRVHGARTWYRGLIGALTVTPAEPFESVPLRWELAYGGSDASDPKHFVEEPRNPVGRGVARDPAALINQPAPQIEDPAEPITSPRGRPTPAGVGALGRHWEPRRAYTGTMDARWQRERMPLLPLDFDPRHNQLATPALIAPGRLRGDERVDVVGACADGPLSFALPRVAFFVGARGDDNRLTEYRSELDTVLLLPNERACELTWRALVPVPRPARRLRAVQVHEKEVRA